MINTVGVLALQGAYQKHVEILSRLNVESRLIRKADELESCDALILPGGESSTISLLIQKNGLHRAIKDFAKHHAVMGVCAGMIMMAEEVDDKRVIPLGLIPFKALRNYYGSQVHSFTAEITLEFDNDTFQAPFIRAPSVENLSSSSTEDFAVLARHNGKAVMLGAGKHIALSFHPELTNDTRIHEYWLNQ